MDAVLADNLGSHVFSLSVGGANTVPAGSILEKDTSIWGERHCAWGIILRTATAMRFLMPSRMCRKELKSDWTETR